MNETRYYKLTEADIEKINNDLNMCIGKKDSSILNKYIKDVSDITEIWFFCRDYIRDYIFNEKYDDDSFIMYLRGYFCYYNYQCKEAMNLYEKAIEMGNVDAINELAYMVGKSYWGNDNRKALELHIRYYNITKDEKTLDYILNILKHNTNLIVEMIDKITKYDESLKT